MKPARVPAAQVLTDDEDIAAVTTVLRSGNLRQGPQCRLFEEEFAAQTGCSHAISVSSGTAALHVAYSALLAPGDEVLVPSFTFIATASMVAMAGAKPIFCDVKPDLFTIDVDDARRRVTHRTRAIAPVHLFGNPCDVAAIQALAAEVGLFVIWDAAQAHGARYAGRDVGTFADAVCYSFYPSKNMTTGEGGMITTSDPELDRRCRLLRSHGSESKYDHLMLGFNYRLTDVMAALGRLQLPRLPEWIATRRKNAELLTDRLAGIEGLTTPRQQPDGQSSFNLYTLALDLERLTCDRDEVARHLREAGVGVSVHYPKPLHQQPAFANVVDGEPLPVSEALADRVLSLPVHPAIPPRDIDWMANIVTEVITAARG